MAQPTIAHDGSRILIDELLIQSDKVTLFEHILNEDEYNTYFQKSDFIMLPYRLKSYFDRTSGVLIEATCSGIPMIATKNSWLSWAMSEYGAGLTVKEADVDDLYSKLLYAIKNEKQLKKEAKSR